MESKMKKLIVTMALGLAVAAAAPAGAHDSPAKHGGIVKSAGDLSFELVNKDGKTTIYVDDHGKAVPMGGASGTLTVLKGGNKTEVPLSGGADNTLVAAGDVKLDSGSKAVAFITFPDKAQMSVRFSVK
jgi:hypothetical protein